MLEYNKERIIALMYCITGWTVDFMFLVYLDTFIFPTILQCRQHLPCKHMLEGA